MNISANDVEYIFNRVNWLGHCELPDSDRKWLAKELAAALSGSESVCDVCGHTHEIIVRINNMRMCESCILEAHASADEIRDELE